MAEKICAICNKKFKGRKHQQTCSRKCGAILNRNNKLRRGEQRYIENLELSHPDIKYISGYKPRTHRGSYNFKVLIKCKLTGFRYYIWSNKLRKKDWQCSICNKNSMFISIYPDDEQGYKHYLNLTSCISPITFYPRKCKWCGNYFTVNNRHNLKVCCSSLCSKKYQNHKKQVKKDYRFNLAKKNGKYEDITLAKLYKRDNGKCYICGKHLILNDKYNRPDAPTIEHVVPISKGGTNTWSNVKLACRECNVKKGTKIFK